MPSFESDKVSSIHQQLHSQLPSDSALRVKALETVLVKKGLINSQTTKDRSRCARASRVGVSTT